jgi:hypothetical protein
MQSVVALRTRPRAPVVQCLAKVDCSTQVRVEIFVTAGRLLVQDTFYIHYIYRPIVFDARHGQGRLECQLGNKHYQRSLMIAVHQSQHGFHIEVPHDYPQTGHRSATFYTANHMLYILETISTACAEYPSMMQGLQALEDWVKRQ